MHMHITAQVYLYVCCWPVTGNNPCYTMIHCDTDEIQCQV